ncbi:hypothetical protein CHL76_10870 [Marinococcus halophilus]|nr:hypothetical protein CHL76_10870 [Marinococcus halophilus]
MFNKQEVGKYLYIPSNHILDVIYSELLSEFHTGIRLKAVCRNLGWGNSKNRHFSCLYVNCIHGDRGLDIQPSQKPEKELTLFFWLFYLL